MRERLGLSSGSEIEIVEDDGRVMISRPPIPVRVERRDDGPVLVAEGADVPPLTARQVRDILERVRERHG